MIEIWESFKNILSTYMKVHNKQKIAQNMGISHNKLHTIISKKGNPSLKTIFKLFDAIEKEVA